LEITYHGKNCLKFSSKNLTILYDPTNDINIFSLKPDVIIYSIHQAQKPRLKEGLIIDGPGEYEIKNTTIVGVSAQLLGGTEGQRSTIYLVHLNDLSLAMIGNIASKLNDDQLDHFGPINVLSLPVGGKSTAISAATAAEIISQIEPNYVIPTYFDDGKTKYDQPVDTLEPFLKETGMSGEAVLRAKINTKELPIETSIIILKRD